MELIFIGVGGGRMVTERQYPNYYTGGFRLHTNNLKFHIDPGPSAILRSSEMGIKVENTDILIVSHNHLDHGSDANLIGEAMNGFSNKKEGVLITSKNSIESENRIIIPMVQNLFLQKFIPKPEDVLEITHKNTTFKFKTTTINHPEPTGWGFVLEIDNKRIGYTSDTLYYEGLGKKFEHVDVLIANFTKIKASKWGEHLNIKTDFEKLIKEAKPKKIIIYHVGEEIIYYGNTKLLKELRSKYEVKYGVEIYLPLSGDKIEI